MASSRAPSLLRGQTQALWWWDAAAPVGWQIRQVPLLGSARLLRRFFPGRLLGMPCEASPGCVLLWP
eukprot:16438800-Heterocapsa_arctica.AAC.1